MMAEFNVGDVVYLRDEVVARYKVFSGTATKLLSGQEFFAQIGLAKDIPFTIVDKKYNDSFCITDFSDGWGTYQNGGGRGVLWEGKECKTWTFRAILLEKRKRDRNTISLYELNRGL